MLISAEEPLCSSSSIHISPAVIRCRIRVDCCSTQIRSRMKKDSRRITPISRTNSKRWIVKSESVSFDTALSLLFSCVSSAPPSIFLSAPFIPCEHYCLSWEMNRKHVYAKLTQCSDIWRYSKLPKTKLFEKKQYREKPFWWLTPSTSLFYFFPPGTKRHFFVQSLQHLAEINGKSSKYSKKMCDFSNWTQIRAKTRLLGRHNTHSAKVSQLVSF